MASRHRTNPGRDYRIICGVYGLAFGLIMTMLPLYKIRELGLDAFQLVILGTIFEISITLCEVPTGIVADLKSRKLSVTIGHFMSGAAFLVAGFATTFAMLAFSSVIWGVGETFVSGAREAWIADELAASDSSESAEHAFVSGNQWLLIGRFIGTWGSVALAISALNVPVIFGGIILIGLGFFTLRISENGFMGLTKGSNTLRNMATTFKKGWTYTVASAALVAVILTNFLMGFSSEGFDRLWQKVIDDNFVLPSVSLAGIADFDLFWYAILNSGAMILTVILLAIITRARLLSNITLIRRTVFAMVIVVLIGLILFGLANTLAWAIVAFLLVRTVRRAFDPLLVSWVNQHAQPEIRATLLSFSGQMHSFGEILGGPIIGTVAKLTTMRIAMFASAALLAPGLPLLLSRMRKADSSHVPWAQKRKDRGSSGKNKPRE